MVTHQGHYWWNQVWPTSKQTYGTYNSAKCPCFEVSGPRDVLHFDACLFSDPFPDPNLVENLMHLPWQTGCFKFQIPKTSCFNSALKTCFTRQESELHLARRSGCLRSERQPLEHRTSGLSVASQQVLEFGYQVDGTLRWFHNLHMIASLWTFNAAREPSGPCVCPRRPKFNEHILIFWVEVR